MNLLMLYTMLIPVSRFFGEYLTNFRDGCSDFVRSAKGGACHCKLWKE